jgi:hypothetical protein
VLNLLMETDWRSLARWGLGVGLRGLLADEGGIPSRPLPRYVQRFACLRCEQHYLSTDTEPQPCPHCHRPLEYVARWDLLAERSPRWWRDALDPGERP